MNRSAEWRMLMLALALIAGSTARAQNNADVDLLKPDGPVTLTADSAEWVQGGAMEYEGNVSLQSGALTLRGDRMTVTQSADGQFEAQITGAPAHLKHLGVADSPKSITAQPVDAEAKRMDYSSREGIIRLRDSARLLRNGDEVAGGLIEYVVAERRIKAAGGQNGQVRIVIQPPPKNGGKTPAPAAAPATTQPAPTPAAATVEPTR
ncbi:MAG: lipopolysaccharide transport periplasmic protein LptA [Pseudomonadota bacterium]|nr:lipopolysaccharide transport periplasmic protein LptA [Pseudomonadota bacterium]